MIVTQDHRDDLIKIAKKLERKSRSFAKDENGEPTESYLEYISMMYPPEVAKIVIYLPVFPQTISLLKLRKQLGMGKEDILKILEEPAKRGFIVSMGKSYAQLNPLLTYDMPFILKRNYDQEDVKQFAELSRKFFVDDKYYMTWQTSRKGIPRFRVLTVSEEVEDEKEIVPIEEVYKIIDMWDDFAIIPCPCRQRREVEGIRECKDKYPIHNCVLFGPMAKAVLDMDDPIVKSANSEEIKKVTKEAAEIGLVHMTDNRAENCIILCACCECCCGMLRGLTRFDNPRAIAKANFISSIDSELCTGCETCLNRCKTDAIIVETIAEVNPDKCIGCGLCAVTCPSDAITMKRFKREQIPS